MAAGDSLLSFDALEHIPASISTAGYLLPSIDRRGPGRAMLIFQGGFHPRAAYFEGVMPRTFSGGGAVVRLVVASAGATSGYTVWYIGFERHDVTRFLGADSFAPVRAAVPAANAVAGAPTYIDAFFESNAALDGIQAGDHFRMMVLLNTAENTAPGDTHLFAVDVREPA